MEGEEEDEAPDVLDVASVPFSLLACLRTYYYYGFLLYELTDDVVYGLLCHG